MRVLVLNRRIPKGRRPDPLVQEGVGGWTNPPIGPSIRMRQEIIWDRLNR